MTTPEKKDASQVKKPYNGPTIRYYGAIGAITESVGMMGMMDGAMMVANVRTA